MTLFYLFKKVHKLSIFFQKEKEERIWKRKEERNISWLCSLGRSQRSSQGSLLLGVLHSL